MTDPRPLETIQQEHNQTAYQAGIVGYQIECLKRELNILNTKLLNLNEEGAEAKKLVDEKAKTEIKIEESKESVAHETIATQTT